MINAMEIKFLRKVLEKTKWDIIRNEEIKQESIMTKIKTKKLNCYGHFVVIKPGRIERKAMEIGKL